jgi:hypothetical protein
MTHLPCQLLQPSTDPPQISEGQGAPGHVGQRRGGQGRLGVWGQARWSTQVKAQAHEHMREKSGRDCHVRWVTCPTMGVSVFWVFRAGFKKTKTVIKNPKTPNKPNLIT